MKTLGDLLQESSGNLLVGGELGEIHGDEDLLGLLVDITNINTALVGEENPVALISWSVIGFFLELHRCWSGVHKQQVQVRL